MDVPAMINALRQGEMIHFAELFQAYADQYEEIVFQGQRGVIVRLGLTEIGVTPDGDVSVHTHDDMERAVNCFNMKVSALRSMIAVAEKMSGFLDSLTNGQPVPADNPLIGVTVPDDLRGLVN